MEELDVLGCEPVALAAGCDMDVEHKILRRGPDHLDAGRRRDALAVNVALETGDGSCLGDRRVPDTDAITEAKTR